MLLACAESSSDEEVRSRILKYLEATPHSDALDLLIAQDGVEMSMVKDITDMSKAAKDAADLRGQVSRYLESYPDHPGLLALRAIGEFFSSDTNEEVVKQNLIAAIASGSSKYGLSVEEVNLLSTWAIELISNHDRELGIQLVGAVLALSPKRETAIGLISDLPFGLCEAPCWFLLQKLEEQCSDLARSWGG
jgi:hypothetical protein